MQELPKSQFDISTQETMTRVRREMVQSPFRFDFDNEPTAAKDGLWVLILTLSSIAFSYAFACATPFAALGALAATRMRLGTGLALMVGAWGANQFIGFFILGYPHTWDSFGWGAAIGAAALLGALAAREVSVLLRNAFLSSLAAGRNPLQVRIRIFCRRSSRRPAKPRREWNCLKPTLLG